MRPETSVSPQVSALRFRVFFRFPVSGLSLRFQVSSFPISRFSVHACGPWLIHSPVRRAHPFDRLRMTLSRVEWVRAPSRGAGARSYTIRG